MTRRMMIVVAIFGICCSAASGSRMDETTILYVNVNSLVNENGRNWNHPYRDLQDALKCARKLPEIEEIWVAGGVYPTDQPGGNRERSFDMVPGVKIIGGFVGDQQRRDERDPVLYPTILTGDIDDDGPDNNAYHVIRAVDLTQTAAVIGCSIVCGVADGMGEFSRGGGIYVRNSSLEVTDCIVSKNTAIQGGGVFVTGIGSMLMRGSLVTMNSSHTGGGMFIDDGIVTARNSTIAGNLATIAPGIYVNRPAGTGVGGSQFRGNAVVDDIVGLGQISPGTDEDPLETITITGNLNLGLPEVGFPPPSGSAILDVYGGVPIVDHDRLVVTQSLLLAGGLTIRIPPGFDPANWPGLSLPIVASQGFDGRFDVAHFPSLDGYAFTIAYPLEEEEPGGPSFDRNGGGTTETQVLLGLVEQPTDATFQPPIAFDFGGGTTGGMITDIDSDGFIDLLLVRPGIGESAPGQIVLLHNGGPLADSWAGFDLPTMIPTGVDPSSVAVGDFDGDGLLDLAVSNTSDNTVTTYHQFSGSGFEPGSTIETGLAPTVLHAVDLDGLNGTDLFVLNSMSGTISVAFNLGDGNFAPASEIPVGPDPNFVDPFDLDQDKDIDIVGVSLDGSAFILVNDGAGGFSAPVTTPVGKGPVQVQGVQLTPDGFPEIVTINQKESSVGVMVNTSIGIEDEVSFSGNVPLVIAGLPTGMSVADMDGDEDPDIAVLLSDGTMTIIRNDSVGAQAQLVVTQNVAAGPSPLALAIGDIDGDGLSDVITINSSTGAPTASRGGEGAASDDVTIIVQGDPLRCPCDWDANGLLNSSDFFAFLDGFFGGEGDYDGSGETDSTDFFGFLSCFFEPLPWCN